jgi:hypothetical protein
MKLQRRKFIKLGSVISGGLFINPALSNPNSRGETEAQKVVLVPGKANKHTLDLGMGFNWFEHLGAGGYYARWSNYPLSSKVYPELDDTQGWNAIEQGLEELNPGWIRFGLPPDPHVAADGSFVKGTVHFKHLEWLNAWAVKRNKTILLDLFLMPRYYEFHAPEGTKDPGMNIVNMAAADNRAYARNFLVPMMEYIIKDLKLETVRLFNPVNEPMEYGVYQTPGNNPPAMAHYVSMYTEIRKALDEAGIDNKRIGLVGLDCGNPTKFILEQHALGMDIDPFIEAYSVHHYNLRLDYLPPVYKPDTGSGYFNKGLNVVIEQDDKMFLEYARLREKPLWALEMGTFYYGKWTSPEGVATIDATITVAEGIIRALNMGISAFSIWSLMNPNDVDGHWAVMGQKNGKLVRYKYPFAVYGLLGNHFKPGAIVFPMMHENGSKQWSPGEDVVAGTVQIPEIKHVYATAIENPGNEFTFLIINDHPKDLADVELRLPEHWKSDSLFTVSMVTREKLNENTGQIKAVNGRITIQCPPFSLIGLKVAG